MRQNELAFVRDTIAVDVKAPSEGDFARIGQPILVTVLCVAGKVQAFTDSVVASPVRDREGGEVNGLRVVGSVGLSFRHTRRLTIEQYIRIGDVRNKVAGRVGHHGAPLCSAVAKESVAVGEWEQQSSSGWATAAVTDRVAATHVVADLVGQDHDGRGGQPVYAERAGLGLRIQVPQAVGHTPAAALYKGNLIRAIRVAKGVDVIHVPIIGIRQSCERNLGLVEIDRPDKDEIHLRLNEAVHIGEVVVLDHKIDLGFDGQDAAGFITGLLRINHQQVDDGPVVTRTVCRRAAAGDAVLICDELNLAGRTRE